MASQPQHLESDVSGALTFPTSLIYLPPILKFQEGEFFMQIGRLVPQKF